MAKQTQQQPTQRPTIISKQGTRVTMTIPLPPKTPKR